MAFDASVASGGLRAARARANETQEQGATRSGLKLGSLKLYEQGDAIGGMSLERAWMLADHFGCSIDDLVDRKIS